MPVKIFFCYAREDEALLKQLKTHLKPLQHKGLIDMWYDRHISPGTDWKRAIAGQLDSAQIILLLLSPDFMASEYCFGVEMNRALERHMTGEARVIPIILRPVYWDFQPLTGLQALPKDAKPVTRWQSSDDAFFNIVYNIQRIVNQMINPQLEETEELDDFEDIIEDPDDSESHDDDDDDDEEPEPESSRPREKLLKSIPRGPFPATHPETVSYKGSFPTYSRQLFSLAISLNGDILVTVSDGGEENENIVQVWSLHTGALLNSFSQNIWRIAICPDGYTLVAIGLKTIVICDLRTGKVINTYPGDPSFSTTLALSPDGKILATTGVFLTEDQEIYLWNVQTGDVLNTFEGDKGDRSIVFSPDGQTLFSAAEESRRIKAWNMHTGRCFRTLKGQSVVQSLALSLNGQTLASTGTYEDKSDHKIELWDLHSEKQLKTIVGPPSIHFLDLTVSPDGQVVACACYDGKVRIWNPYTSKLLNTFQAYEGPVTRALISPDGQTLVTTGSEDKSTSTSREVEVIKVWGMK